ncbi:MAG: 2Fe-2S iron-sulfur cluster-binding protein [Sinimarinibacterium sp.]
MSAGAPPMAAAPMGPPPSIQNAPAAGMAQGMEQMMERMGAPAPKELYPALMELPDLPPEKREQVKWQAHERMKEGTRLMSLALGDLSQAAPRDDYSAMQAATASMRQGLAQFESGLAAHRALAEGKAPRNVAMQWFKREMNLLSPMAAQTPHGFFGLSLFHYVTMAFVAAFAVLLLLIYLARQRRASALAAQLAGGPGTIGGGELAAAAPSPSSVPAMPSVAGGHMPQGAHTVLPVSTTGSWSGQLRVARIFQETADVKTFRLAPLAGEELPFAFEPGQFLTVAATVDGKLAKRSYSIASSPCCHGWCEITVKHARGGVVSGYLHGHVKVGDVLEAAGPYGRFTFRGHEAPHVVMIAGGVGITPLMSSIRFLTDQSWMGEIWLICAFPRLDSAIFREELDYLAKRHPNLHVTLVLSDEPSTSWGGARGFVTPELLAQSVPDLGSRRVHVCGPPPMMEAVKKALAQLGVASDHVHTELFLTPEVKRAPPAEAAPTAAAPTCSFARSGKKAPLPPDKTVLEAADDVGVAIDYSCRQGFCGACKVKLLAGQVTMEVEDGLTPADRTAGLVLACQAKAKQDVTVEA